MDGNFVADVRLEDSDEVRGQAVHQLPSLLAARRSSVHLCRDLALYAEVVAVRDAEFPGSRQAERSGAWLAACKSLGSAAPTTVLTQLFWLDAAANGRFGREIPGAGRVYATASGVKGIMGTPCASCGCRSSSCQSSSTG